MSAAALAALHRASFTQPPPWSEADFTSFLADRTCLLLTRRQGGALAAFALFRRVLDEAEVLTLACAPERRREGHARALMRDGLAQLQARGARSCFLEVAEDNAPARALYRGLGFTEQGLRRGYYQAPGQPAANAVILRVTLG